MRIPKPLILAVAFAAVVLGLTVWILVPRIKKQLTSADIAWDAERASFSVIGLITLENPDVKIVNLLCQWDTPQRFGLDFPGSEISVSSGARYTAGVSPVGGASGRFEIHYYCREFPSFFKRLDIPIRCSNARGDSVMRMLSLRYWPSRHGDFRQFFTVETGQQPHRADGGNAGS